MVRKSDPDNIWNHIKLTNSCWIWEGALNINGYGHLTFKKKRYLAHRFVYEYLVGEITKELQIDHLCRNKACVNPDHLEAVTSKINTNRGIGNGNKEKIHCKNGHPFDEKNTYYYQEGTYLKRKCKLCMLFGNRRFRKKQKVMLINV